MGLTMKEKSDYKAGSFTLSKGRTEREGGYPKRIYSDHRIQPEVRSAYY
jgi:hypothetical protein